jgi:predicted amidohydrolase YtcJ
MEVGVEYRGSRGRHAEARPDWFPRVLRCAVKPEGHAPMGVGRRAMMPGPSPTCLAGGRRGGESGGCMAARLTTYVVVGIVAATLIAGLIVGAQRDDDGPVDLIVHNARIYTADEDRSVAEAVAIRGNQILRVGSNREINRLRRPQTTVIDAQGATVLPGFNDAHVHLIDGGLTLEMLDLHDALTPDAVTERLAAWAAANPAHSWIRARRWMDGEFDGAPTRQVLDAAVPDRPVQIVSADGRTSWVNTKALKMAGVTRRTQSPAGGTIVRDAHGDATGVLRDAAAGLVEKLLPPPTREAREKALRAAIDAANRHGITSVQTADDTVADFELYDAARMAGDLTVRVYGALALSIARLSDTDTDRLAEIAKKYPDDPRFKTGAARVTIDGDVESHTAAMLAPYETDPAAAEPLVDADDLNRNVRILDAYGWQVMADASGDRAVNMALNAYAHAVRSNAAPSRGRRHRIDHVESIADADLARLGPLNVLTSLLPHEGSIEKRVPHIGMDRAARGATRGRIASAGGRLALGSDWPASDLDPFAVLQATTSPDVKETAQRSRKADRVDLQSAIDGYTSNAAFASFDEQRKGSITPGMLADIVVLTEDIFASPAAFSSAKVAVTIFDGKIVYRRGEKTTNP